MTLHVIGTRALRLALMPNTPLPHLRLGVATYLKTHAGKCCTAEEIAAWVYPAGPWARPDDIAKVLTTVITQLRKEGAPIERKQAPGLTVIGRYGSFRWRREGENAGAA